MADLDGDGHLDVLSGAYWPGHVFWFRGLGDGEFAASEILEDRGDVQIVGGEPIVKGESPDMDSLASAPWLIDWDADGDLDLLIGSIGGRIIRVVNDGTPTGPRFTTERVVVEAGGQPIDVGGGDSGPTTADWDGDGLWDLIVGAGDGSVWFYRNEGTAKAPSFAAGRVLVAAPEDAWEPIPFGQAPTRSGVRLKPHVVDYDGDGDLDLLVGDYASEHKPDPELTDEQSAHRDELRAQRDAISKELAALRQIEGADAETKRDEVIERWRQIYEELSPLEPGTISTGFVWLYRRTASTGTK